MEDQPFTLLCISHLNWDHVWQRPQHLMSRFSQHCRVIYVDPPELVAGVEQSYLQERDGAYGVRVVRPIFPDELLDTPGHSFRELWLRMLPTVLQEAGDNVLLWIFSPLFDYLVEAAHDYVQLTVYDCMDDLASFRGGSDTMRQREAQLLSLVDLVFTGGRSMYEARKDRHARVYCFPSGVDVEHYRQVADPTTQIPAVVANLPQPRLGYFGVLDERIDWELIAAIAEQRPDWHWVMVGPTAKIEQDDLPTGPNIHYLGQQSYADLPAFLKSFDLATMPFALNDATRFISPTKTLEYLAGGKDVISSSVPDVVASYKGIVTVVDGVESWIAAIEHLINASSLERAARQQRAQPLLEEGSWDGIAARMWTIMHEHRTAR